MKKAVILFSGGLDSSTVLAIAKNKNFICFPLTINYGQRHAAELEAAKKIVTHLGIHTHKIIELPQTMFGASALTDSHIDVPDYAKTSTATIPITYVPARNTIFLSIALGYAEEIGAQDIFIGISQIDYSGYPDCRAAFLNAFEALANVATKAGVAGEKISIHAPLLYLSKADTIRLGLKHGVDYALTVSCYRANASNGSACGICDSCTYRQRGFAEAGVPDPTLYLFK